MDQSPFDAAADALKNLTDAPICDRSESDSLALFLLCTLFGFLIFIVAAVVALLHYWDEWYPSKVSMYFVALDRDKSGRVNRDELYTGVLQLYAAVPMKVYPPKRPTVDKILSYLESKSLIKQTDELDIEEFSVVMATLSAQCLSRLLFTFTWYIFCPVLAGVIWTFFSDYVLDGGGEIGLDVTQGVPHLVRCGGSVINQLHLGPPLLTVVLMLPVKRVVRTSEKCVKSLALIALHLRRYGLRAVGAGDEGGGGGLEDEEDVAEEVVRMSEKDIGEPSEMRFGRTQRRIAGSIRRRSIAAPLLSPESGLAGDAEEEEEQAEEEALALAHAKRAASSRTLLMARSSLSLP